MQRSDVHVEVLVMNKEDEQSKLLGRQVLPKKTWLKTLNKIRSR